MSERPALDPTPFRDEEMGAVRGWLRATRPPHSGVVDYRVVAIEEAFMQAIEEAAA